MTTREEFLKSAMQGLLSNPTWLATTVGSKDEEEEQLNVLYEMSANIADYFVVRMQMERKEEVNEVMEQKQKLRSMRTTK